VSVVHAFTHRIGFRSTFRSPLRAIAAGFLFVVLAVCASASDIGFYQTNNDGTWRWTNVPGGWVVETPLGGAVKFPDKNHKWDGSGDIDSLADGTMRLKIPAGWIIQTPKGGAEYIADSRHTWAPALYAQPPPTPEPSATPEPSLTPSASPSPAPSASPASPSSPAESDRVRTRPTAIEEMTEVRPGVWRSGDLSKTRKAVLQFHLSQPVPRGKRLRITAAIASNVSIDNSRNIKFFTRNWLKIVGAQALNDYICSQKAGNPVFVTEQITPVTAKDGNEWTRFYRSWPKFTSTPTLWVGEWKYPTEVGKADGSVAFSVGGNVVFKADKWKADDANHPGTRDIICIQVIYAPVSGDAGDLPPGSYVEFSNVSVEVLP
jgi:hypothetical protein